MAAKIAINGFGRIGRCAARIILERNFAGEDVELVAFNDTATRDVVAPAQVALPGGVLRALEDPPLGGPVAGIAAGLAHLGRCGPAAGLIRVLTCDAPTSWRALPALIEALYDGDPGADGVCARDGDHVQYLLGLYRRAVLAAAVTPGGAPLRDVAVRRVLGRLRVSAITLPHGIVRDLDTWDEVRAWDCGLCE